MHLTTIITQGNSKYGLIYKIKISNSSDTWGNINSASGNKSRKPAKQD